jgi:hypothetical protein
MGTIGALLLTIGTLVIVVPARDGVVIVADSKSTRRAGSGTAAGVSASEKVFELPGVPGHAFFVTGVSPVEWVVGGSAATVVDARGVVSARLSGRGAVSREAFDAVAAECAKLAARIHRMGQAAAPLFGHELFSVVMTRAAAGGGPHEVASFVVRLTGSGAEVSKREWMRFAQGDTTQVLMFGEGAFVGSGLSRWDGGSAECARQFLGSGRKLVRDMEIDAAAQGAYSIQEATSTAMGDAGTVGPPFRAYLLSRQLREMPPVAPCR